jgi:hypothetical protein
MDMGEFPTYINLDNSVNIENCGSIEVPLNGDYIKDKNGILLRNYACSLARFSFSFFITQQATPFDGMEVRQIMFIGKETPLLDWIVA